LNHACPSIPIKQLLGNVPQAAPALGTGLDIDGKNAGCVSSAFGRKLLLAVLKFAAGE